MPNPFVASLYVQALAAHRTSIQLQDCWYTFSKSLTDYPKWGNENWVPTADECIAARVRTSGIVEEQFTIEDIVFKVGFLLVWSMC